MSVNQQNLAKEIREFLWRENPVEATMAGLKRYDDRLENLDLISRRNKVRQKKLYLTRISELEKSEKIIDELETIKDQLEVGVVLEEKLRSLDRDAAAYPRLAIYGLYQLMATRRNEDPREKALRVIGRMRDIPRLLDEGKLNLSYGKDIPRMWTRAAIDLTCAGRGYIEVMAEHLRKLSPEVGEVILSYSGRAIEALDTYLRFLIGELQRKSDGQLSVDRELFDFIIKRGLGLESDAETLYESASAGYKRCLAELEKLADGGNWKKMVRSAGSELETMDSLEKWKKLIEKVRREIEKSGLVGLSDPEELVIEETPVFDRSTVQVCGYFPAPLLDEEQDAYFFVSPVNGDDKTRTINAAEAVLKVAGELYPGRHTLVSIRKKLPGDIVNITRGGVAEEGWCRYACDLLAGCGEFSADRDIRILNLHGRLLDALRVMVDIEVNLKGSSEEDAVASFQERSALSEEVSQREVRMIGCNPTSSVPAFAGRLMIEGLVENWKKENPNKKLASFSEKYFHLSTLPPVKILKNFELSVKEEVDSSAD